MDSKVGERERESERDYETEAVCVEIIKLLTKVCLRCVCVSVSACWYMCVLVYVCVCALCVKVAQITRTKYGSWHMCNHS